MISLAVVEFVLIGGTTVGTGTGMGTGVGVGMFVSFDLEQEMARTRINDIASVNNFLELKKFGNNVIILNYEFLRINWFIGIDLI